MMALQMFPVWKKYDQEKGKWQKVPAIPKGQDWHTYAAKESELTKAENIGVVIPSGVLVIDLDIYKGVTREKVEAALGCTLDWDLSELQRTVSGGEHHAFSIPDGVTVRQGDSLLGVDGFDTRASGKGWICTGEGYEDLTILGLVETMQPHNLPALPDEAIMRLSYGYQVDRNNELADLDAIIGAQPLDDVTLEDIRAYLKRLPDSAFETYQSWLNIGMACHHQTGGSVEGAKAWAEASKRSSHYDPQEIKDKWRSFGRRTGSGMLTFAYVIKLAGGKAAIAQDRFEALLERASTIEHMDEYESLKREVRSIGAGALGPDLRAMIAAELADGFGKDKGITRSDIKRALMPEKVKAVVRDDDAAERPDWVLDWLYVEMRCEFAHKLLGYSIKREAFCAKYDRMADCLLAERSAAAMALTDYRVETVVDEMFWPGMSQVFDYDGKAMLNTYRPQGVQSCGAVIDDDGQDVVDLFLGHLHMIVGGDRERRILLDWLAYVYQNPGQRINWALLLQGAQGIGKTYFVSVLQMLMGSLVTNLDPTAITGRFTSWAHGSVVVAVEEIRINGTNKFETMDRLKPFITNSTVQIEEKGRDHRTVPNFTSYFLLTNYKDAIPLAAGDRRYCVIFSRLQSEEELYQELGGEKAAGEYFTRLFSESERRADALASFLGSHVVSADFEPKGRAPETDARQMMMGVSVSAERDQVEDAIVKYECEVINGDLLDVTWLNRQCAAEGDLLPAKRTLSAILLEMGYSQANPRRVKIGRELHYFWYKPLVMAGVEAKERVRIFHKG